MEQRSKGREGRGPLHPYVWSPWCMLQSFPLFTVRRRSCAASRPTGPTQTSDALAALSLRQEGGLAATRECLVLLSTEKAEPACAQLVGTSHGAAPEARSLRPG